MSVDSIDDRSPVVAQTIPLAEGDHYSRGLTFQTGARIWCVAVLVGWSLGVVEGLGKAIKLAFGAPEPMGYDILYVAPLTYACAAALIAAPVLVIVGLLLRMRRATPRGSGWLAKAVRMAPIVFAVAPVAFVLSRAVFHTFFKTSVYAEVLIAVGLAYQITRLFMTRPRLVGASIRSVSWAGALTLVVALMIVGSGRVSEARTLAALPPASPGAPNVLFITLDTLRADHLSAYGHTRPTPNLDRIAAEGAFFEYAIAPSSWTLPSHASMFTGRRVSEHLAEMNTGARLDDRFLVVTEIFARNGYATGAFIANDSYCAANRGFGRGFARYDDLFHDPISTIGLTRFGSDLLASRRLGGTAGRSIRTRKMADEVSQEFLDWLPARGERPFFVWLNYFDVHDPYYAPPPFDRRYGEKPAHGIESWWYAPSQTPPWAGDENPPEGRRMADAYDCAIAYLDAEMGRLFAALHERGQLDDTIVVVTSDHGEGFGEHGIYDHGNSLYRELLHVPLFIRYPPRFRPGTRFAEPADLCNLPATMLALAGIPNRGEIPGTLLDTEGPGIAVSELLQNPYQAPWQQAARGNIFSIVTADWHAIFSADGAQLFSRTDVREQFDLADTDQGKVVLEELRARLEVALSGGAETERRASR
jgi:arylsulfatase A-like enzyme